MTIRIDKVKPHIGGLIHVDKARLCEPEVVAACRAALEERGVIVFPEIHLSDAEQLAFTDAFGERVNFTRRVPGGNEAEPDVYKITLDRKINSEPEYVLGTWFWHIDGITMDQPLPKATMLSARTLSGEGGQTEFANTYAVLHSRTAFEDHDDPALRRKMLQPLQPPPQRRQWYSVRGTISLKSTLVAMASGRACQKLGQPVPLSYLARDENRGRRQPAQA